MGGKAMGGRRIDLAEAESIFAKLQEELLPLTAELVLAGSARRGKPTCGDVDIVLVAKPFDVLYGNARLRSMASRKLMTGAWTADQNKVIQKLLETGVQPTPLDLWMYERFGMQKNGKPQKGGLIDGVQVEFYVSAAEDFGSQLQMWTGSMEHNVVLRGRALRQGYSLSQYGLKKGEERRHFAEEVDLYDFLGEKWRFPTER